MQATDTKGIIVSHFNGFIVACWEAECYNAYQYSIYQGMSSSIDDITLRGIKHLLKHEWVQEKVGWLCPVSAKKLSETGMIKGMTRTFILCRSVDGCRNTLDVHNSAIFNTPVVTSGWQCINNKWYCSKYHKDIEKPPIRTFDGPKSLENYFTLSTPTKEMLVIQTEIHAWAVGKGWWEAGKSKTFIEQLALFHSEISEALEHYRDGRGVAEVFHTTDNEGRDKPDGVPIELADLIIRVLDTCGKYNIPIWEYVWDKMRYNYTRSYRHGDKKA